MVLSSSLFPVLVGKGKIAIPISINRIDFWNPCHTFAFLQLCKYDFVEIRGGFSADAEPIVDKLCGNSMPGTVTSPSNKLYIQFRSDSTVSKRGFFATFFAGKSYHHIR